MCYSYFCNTIYIPLFVKEGGAVLRQFRPMMEKACALKQRFDIVQDSDWVTITEVCLIYNTTATRRFLDQRLDVISKLLMYMVYLGDFVTIIWLQGTPILSRISDGSSSEDIFVAMAV